MIERLRILLDRPLDRRLRVAVLLIACAVTVGFAAILALAGGARRSSERPQRHAGPLTSPAPRSEPSRPSAPGPSRPRAHPAQDPQNRHGSAAARRAERELREHRALQHVPYRRGPARVSLVGAKGRRAILRVSAPTLAEARAAWRAFLRSYSDSGRAYLPRFRAPGGRRG